MCVFEVRARALGFSVFGEEPGEEEGPLVGGSRGVSVHLRPPRPTAQGALRPRARRRGRRAVSEQPASPRTGPRERTSSSRTATSSSGAAGGGPTTSATSTTARAARARRRGPASAGPSPTPRAVGALQGPRVGARQEYVDAGGELVREGRGGRRRGGPRSAPSRGHAGAGAEGPGAGPARWPARGGARRRWEGRAGVHPPRAGRGRSARPKRAVAAPWAFRPAIPTQTTPTRAQRRSWRAFDV